MTKYIPTVMAVCCRSWPVDPTTRIGRCGLCGERPTIIPGAVMSAKPGDLTREDKAKIFRLMDEGEE